MNTVLIIDDDPDYRKFLGELLQPPAWHVIEAEEGNAGIELAKLHRPAVVLCDLMMPGCNGFQVCRALRSDDSLRQTRIVITSGRQFESDRQAAFKAGADEYITKPIEPGRLVASVRRALESAAEGLASA